MKNYQANNYEITCNENSLYYVKYHNVIHVIIVWNLKTLYLAKKLQYVLSKHSYVFEVSVS